MYVKSCMVVKLLVCHFSQPAIYVTSLAAVELLRVREGGEQIINSVDVTCGLSLGEYTALAFAGAFRLVHHTTLSHIFKIPKSGQCTA